MVKNLPAMQETLVGSRWVRKIPWRRKWQPTPVSVPGESRGKRSLVDYSPRAHKELDMTEQLTYTPYSEEISLPFWKSEVFCLYSCVL